MEDKSLAQRHLTLWEDVHASRAWGRYPPEEMIRFVGRNYFRASDRSALRFLEMGCGQGANLWFLAREGFSVAGIDGAPSAIRKALERFKAEGLPSVAPWTDLRVGNFSELPWPDENFDAVFDIEAIYANEMAVVRQCITEAHRVLKSRGKIFAKMFGTETSGFGTGTNLEIGTTLNPATGPCAGFGITHFFSDAEIKDLFSSFANLKLDWVKRTDHSGAQVVFEWIVEAQK